MRFGVVPHLDPSVGGVFQYGVTLSRQLAVVAAARGDELVVVIEHESDLVEARRLFPSTEVLALRRRSRRGQALAAVRRVLGEGPARRAMRRFRAATRAAIDVDAPPGVSLDRRDRLLRARVTWQFFSSHNADSFQSGIPYVSAIHDLQHRLQPEFPEVAHGDLYDRNEWLLRNICRQAKLLVADSDVGREDILNFYGDWVSPDRVVVLPYLPSSSLIGDSPVDAIEESPPYLFYPAQFWPHKNHVRLVEALALARRRHPALRLVLCGSASDPLRTETLRSVNERARALGVDGCVTVLGYVPDADLARLYRGATALVMPTFFGPTNIPVLEAWAQRCPVVTSDLRGIREQCGDAAVLVDPRSSDAIAAGIDAVVSDAGLRATLRERGRARLAAYTVDDHRVRLAAIVERMAHA